MSSDSKLFTELAIWLALGAEALVTLASGGALFLWGWRFKRDLAGHRALGRAALLPGADTAFSAVQVPPDASTTDKITFVADRRDKNLSFIFGSVEHSLQFVINTAAVLGLIGTVLGGRQGLSEFSRDPSDFAPVIAGFTTSLDTTLAGAALLVVANIVHKLYLPSVIGSFERTIGELDATLAIQVSRRSPLPAAQVAPAPRAADSPPHPATPGVFDRTHYQPVTFRR